jgi:hypothetical protein
MSDSQTDKAWTDTPRQLTEELLAHKADSEKANWIRGVIEARAAVAATEAAFWTKWLAIATFLLALATVVLAIIAVYKS